MRDKHVELTLALLNYIELINKRVKYHSNTNKLRHNMLNNESLT